MSTEEFILLILPEGIIHETDEATVEGPFLGDTLIFTNETCHTHAKDGRAGGFGLLG